MTSQKNTDKSFVETSEYKGEILISLHDQYDGFSVDVEQARIIRDQLDQVLKKIDEDAS